MIERPNTRPNTRLTIVGLAAAALLMGGCANMSEREQGTVKGA